jgi:GntR family transcriptional regulator
MTDLIDKTSQIPYYLQLKNILLEKIKQNAFPKGKLPSENELAEKYGITVTTVRKVLSELQNDGRIYKVKGLGSFVKKPKIELDIARYLSFGRLMKEKGLQEEITLLKREVTDFNENWLNGFTLDNPGKKVIHIERTRSIEDEPIAIERLFFNEEICAPMLEKAEDTLIYDFLINELKIDFDRIEEYLEPINLSKEDASTLGVKPNSAALLITKFSFDHENTWLEYSTTIIRGDKCRYHVHLK